MALQDIYYHNTSGSTQTIDDGIEVGAGEVINLTGFIPHDQLMRSSLVFTNVNADDARISLDGVTPLSVADSIITLDSAIILNATPTPANIDHDALTNYSAGEHRVINDAGTSATELWSASKIDSELDNKVDDSEKGANNGVATLDAGGKVPTAQLPASLVGAVSYQGVWNATTNTPTLGNSGLGGVQGDYFVVSVAGTTFVDGNNDWEIGDWLVNNGSTWDKIDNSDKVSSVNGMTGVVSLDTDDVNEGTGNFYYTEGRVSANTDVSANTTHRGTTTGNPHSVTASDLGLDEVQNLKVNLSATTTPNADDDTSEGYAVGSRWIDVTADKEYVCVDDTNGAAVWKETTLLGGGSGETNTASNVGTAGVGVFKQKAGSDLEFKNINAGSNKISITDDTGDDEIDIDVNEGNIDHDALTNYVADEHIDWTADQGATNIHDDNVPHTGVTSGNPHSVTKSDVGLSNVENTKVILTAVVPPDANDDIGSGYTVGSRWFDITADKEYVCLDNTSTAAVWKETTVTSKSDIGLGNVENTKVNFSATDAPDANDDSGSGYSVGSTWIDTTNDRAYVCLDSTATAAVWKLITVPEAVEYDSYTIGAGRNSDSQSTGYLRAYDGTPTNLAQYVVPYDSTIIAVEATCHVATNVWRADIRKDLNTTQIAAIQLTNSQTEKYNNALSVDVDEGDKLSVYLTKNPPAGTGPNIQYPKVMIYLKRR
jgi:hypothetical protein